MRTGTSGVSPVAGGAGSSRVSWVGRGPVEVLPPSCVEEVMRGDPQLLPHPTVRQTRSVLTAASQPLASQERLCSGKGLLNVEKPFMGLDGWHLDCSLFVPLCELE